VARAAAGRSASSRSSDKKSVVKRWDWRREAGQVVVVTDTSRRQANMDGGQARGLCLRGSAGRQVVIGMPSAGETVERDGVNTMATPRGFMT